MASEHDLARMAEDAAERGAYKAVHELFRLLGVDISSQDQLNEFRADLIHARKMRRLWDRAGGHVLMIIISVATGAFIVAMWDTIKAAINAK